MPTEKPHTLEDSLATRLARLGTLTAIIALVVLLAVLFGNVLVLAVKVAVSAVLVVLVNQGPAVAALFGGISTIIGYYGHTRLLRRKEKFNLRDEATDQAMDQAGNALQNAPAALRSQLGCSSSLSLGVFAAALILCCLTYLPTPLHVFGAHVAVATSTRPTPTPTSSTITTGTTTTTTLPLPTATLVPMPTTTTHAVATATATSVPTHAPTATPVPPPGNLLVLPPTTIDLGSYCNQNFTDAIFSFSNNGGTTIYWSVTMPRGLTLTQGYPATGVLQPNEGNSQNEHFQGIRTAAAITLTWGYSATTKSSTASIPLTCKPIG